MAEPFQLSIDFTDRFPLARAFLIWDECKEQIRKGEWLPFWKSDSPLLMTIYAHNQKRMSLRIPSLWE